MTARRHRVAIGAALVLASALLIACNSSSKTGPSPTNETPAAPTPTDTTPSSRTGIQDVDTVIQAVLGRDPAVLRQLVRLRPTPCIGPTPASLGALFCEDGETEGSVVDVLPVAQCETHYTRQDELDQVLQFDPTIKLYAVYRADALYDAVFTQQPDPQGPPFGISVGIDRGLISYIDYGCGQSAAQLTQNVSSASDFIVPPPVEPTADTTATP